MIIDLNGKWKLRNTNDEQWIDAVVPGSLYNDMLNAGLMEDPFYRGDNEQKALELCDHDYIFEKKFFLDSIPESDIIVIKFMGIDTLAEIKLNGVILAKVENMHCTYEYSVKDILVKGENRLEVTIFSPNQFIKDRQEKVKLFGVNEAVEGYPHLRKAHCMFGWDWGPQLPDMGIWRNVYIETYDHARINDVYITQDHTKSNSVAISARVHYTNYRDAQGIMLKAVVTSPDGIIITHDFDLAGGDLYIRREADGSMKEKEISFVIEDPQLWWPNGYGEQPIYSIDFIISAEGVEADRANYKIGLRTIEVDRSQYEFGEKFEFVINGINIFAMGADFVPEDNILARITPDKTKFLIQSCIEANFNCLRVWGGGNYPDDSFFELCDEHGLIVWQDFMFACALYNVDDDFEKNITAEFIDNIKRIRHHACLGLWCGNNEMETAVTDWGVKYLTSERKAQYIKQYEVIIPNVLKEYDPNTFYWPSSPSSGGSFDEPNAFERGDCHYWGVWHGREPLEKFREYYFRFASEFGLQSFPSLKTVETFTLPQDRNVFSYVMEKHQRSAEGNEKILSYISQYLKYPKDFESLLYASQIIQGDGIRNAVEHWRRNRGRCMGSVYWQLNDCWPVASWSSIDSCYRWKALHYFAKRFYAPVLISADEKESSAVINVSNERLSTFKGAVQWKLRNHNGKVVLEDKVDIEIPERTAKNIISLDFKEILSTRIARSTHFLAYGLFEQDEPVAQGTVTFVPAKHFEFIEPAISCGVEEDETNFYIYLSSDVYAKYVELSIDGVDAVFENNYLDLAGADEEIRVILAKDKIKTEDGMGIKDNVDLCERLQIRSIFDIG